MQHVHGFPEDMPLTVRQFAHGQSNPTYLVQVRTECRRGYTTMFRFLVDHHTASIALLHKLCRPDKRSMCCVRSRLDEYSRRHMPLTASIASYLPWGSVQRCAPGSKVHKESIMVSSMSASRLAYLERDGVCSGA